MKGVKQMAERVPGVVDRVEGDIAVIVFRDPDSGDCREIYVNNKKLKRITLKEGEDVTVELSPMMLEPSVKRVPKRKSKASKTEKK